MHRCGRGRWALGGCGSSGGPKLGQDFGMLKVTRDAVLHAVAASRVNFVALPQVASVSSYVRWLSPPNPLTYLDLTRLAPPAAGPRLLVRATRRHVSARVNVTASGRLVRRWWLALSCYCSCAAFLGGTCGSPLSMLESHGRSRPICGSLDTQSCWRWWRARLATLLGSREAVSNAVAGARLEAANGRISSQVGSTGNAGSPSVPGGPAC